LYAFSTLITTATKVTAAINRAATPTLPVETVFVASSYYRRIPYPNDDEERQTVARIAIAEKVTYQSFRLVILLARP
jgi:hypothetical protein